MDSLLADIGWALREAGMAVRGRVGLRPSLGDGEPLRPCLGDPRGLCLGDPPRVLSKMVLEGKGGGPLVPSFAAPFEPLVARLLGTHGSGERGGAVALKALSSIVRLPDPDAVAWPVFGRCNFPTKSSPRGETGGGGPGVVRAPPLAVPESPELSGSRDPGKWAGFGASVLIVTVFFLELLLFDVGSIVAILFVCNVLHFHFSNHYVSNARKVRCSIIWVPIRALSDQFFYQLTQLEKF